MPQIFKKTISDKRMDSTNGYTFSRLDLFYYDTFIVWLMWNIQYNHFYIHVVLMLIAVEK